MNLYPRCSVLNCASRSLVLEVDDDEQLGEEDYVDKVGAHGPEAVDGRDGEGHGRGHGAHDEDGCAHHPQDLGFGCLERRVDLTSHHRTVVMVMHMGTKTRTKQRQPSGMVGPFGRGHPL